MAPQNVSFIENSTDNDEDDKSISPVPAAPASGETARSDSNLSERLSRLNISRGDKTYRVQLHADGREPTALDQHGTSTIIITIIIIIIIIIVVVIIIISSSSSSPSSSSPAGHLPETIVSANNLVNIQGAKARVKRRKWTRVHVWTRVSSTGSAEQTLRGRD